MDIRLLLSKDSLTTDETRELVRYICEEEKKYEGINFNIISYPKEKKKFRLIRKKEDIVTLGFQKTILGFMENKYEVAINHEVLEKHKAKITTLLTTIYHELCHVKQKTKSTKLRYPLVATSIFSKELILTSKNKEYYKSNYHSIYGEADARITSRDKTMRLLERYSQELLEEVKLDFKSRNYIDDALKKLYIHKSGSDLDLGEILISKKMDKIILSNPEIMDSMPALVFEYNNNGKRKDLQTLYEMEPYYLKDKNGGQKMLISSAIDEFMFIYVMLNKEESVVKFYNECGKDGLKRLEKALKNKLKNIQSRKVANKKLLECKYLDKSDYICNYNVLNEYNELIKTYLKLIDKLYISRQSKVK